jgi:pentatricopeptide repeat protein
MQKVAVLSPLRYRSRFVFYHVESQINFLLKPIEPDTCVSLIKQCRTLRSLKSVHASMLISHLHLNLFFSTNLIAQYASLGSMSHAYSLFSTFHSKDVFLWNVMIRGFVDNCLYNRSMLLYSQMRELGIQPDNFTFPFVLKACGCVKDVKFGVVVHGNLMEFGYESDVVVGNSLIAMYGKCERLDISRLVFDKMPQRNVVSWSSMIGAYVQNGHYEEGVSLFSQMLGEGIRPNRAVILNVMACVYRENEADGVCRVVIDNKLDFDRSVQNAAMVMYARCGRIDIARKFFDGILEKDLVSWSSMIEAYAQADLPLEALELFKQMILQRILLDFVTLLSVIRACSNLASFQQARFIHGFITRRFSKNQIAPETALIDLYVKCGSLVYARKVFDKMQERNIISWSTLISGYGIHGHGREALYLFDQMKASIKPDHIAFLSVLSACSHGGLIVKGWECFNSMSRDFQVTPRSEHYACMVDLLGRVGRLNEARDFIERMPTRPEVGVWGALLGACRIHLNVELAEVAAKSLFELDADNSGRYVLLSNIYTSLGKRYDADRVRALMKRRGVRKTAGHTIIEIKNKIYTFVAGDQSNPQTNLIYSELEKIINRIREVGYVPDLNFVLHDVEEEMKEKMLYVHSEKLAIVFGLLNTGPDSVIRIKKNLRVCGDCHTATKFISKVTEREIIVRDAHRFHHFKEGTCSCGDYW